MKLPLTISKSRRTAGVLLIECITYIAVFAILTAIGSAAFYLCWDHSKAVTYATDDIGAALRAGEHWRADVRDATGKISVETSAAGEVMHIPESGKEVVYRFESGQVRREVQGWQNADALLARVNHSQMSPETRDGVTAWRWELDLVVRRTETHLPLLFTFEAAQTKP
jgi:hypothetical protein